MMIQVQDEGNDNEAEDRESYDSKRLGKPLKESSGSSAARDSERTEVDQPSFSSSDNNLGSDVSSLVPDNGSGLREQRSDNKLVGGDGRSSEFSGAVVSKEREYREHNDTGEQRERRSRAERDSDSGGRSDVRQDLRTLAPCKQIDPFQCFRVDPDQVERWWPLVEKGVEYVINKTKAPFTASDVKGYCVKNFAWLIITSDMEGAYAGCTVVAESDLDNFSKRREMLIWVAYSKVPGAAEYTTERLETVAKDHGFGYLVFHSPRPGWVRRAKKLGFTLRERVYEKKLG